MERKELYGGGGVPKTASPYGDSQFSNGAVACQQSRPGSCASRLHQYWAVGYIHIKKMDFAVRCVYRALAGNDYMAIVHMLSIRSLLLLKSWTKSYHKTKLWQITNLTTRQVNFMWPPVFPVTPSLGREGIQGRQVESKAIFQYHLHVS